MAQHTVSAGRSQLEEYVKTPAAGLCELIWNAFDADAHNVNVSIENNSFGGVGSLLVSDDGNGMNRERAELSFSKLGDSWKAHKAQTDAGRALHGKRGRGRYAAFAIASVFHDTRA